MHGGHAAVANGMMQIAHHGRLRGDIGDYRRPRHQGRLDFVLLRIVRAHGGDEGAVTHMVRPEIRGF